jgi:GNAT superfamily N-acetyltransferase
VTDVTVRRASLEDSEAFTRAHEAAWDAALAPIAGRRLEELVPFKERVERFRAGLASPGADASVLVAEREGKIVGEAIRVGSELRDLYVVPEAWGTGAGPALMDEVLAEIRASGATEATLWVVEANGRARRFYEREGWEPTGETRATPLGPAELQYALRLRA